MYTGPPAPTLLDHDENQQRRTTGNRRRSASHPFRPFQCVQGFHSTAFLSHCIHLPVFYKETGCCCCCCCCCCLRLVLAMVSSSTRARPRQGVRSRQDHPPGNGSGSLVSRTDLVVEGISRRLPSQTRAAERGSDRTNPRSAPVRLSRVGIRHRRNLRANTAAGQQRWRSVSAGRRVESSRLRHRLSDPNGAGIGLDLSHSR